jgi:hypothetical protein
MPHGRSSRAFGGRLLGRDDAEYDETRKGYNGMIDKRPALIAACADIEEIARVLAFARERGLPLAVRGGGHNGAGLGTCDDGVVIDLSSRQLRGTRAREGNVTTPTTSSESTRTSTRPRRPSGGATTRSRTGCQSCAGSARSGLGRRAVRRRPPRSP